VAGDAVAPARLTALADRAATALAPLACGSYINFPSSRVGGDWEAEYFGENRSRLRAVKRAYDPEDFFRHAQSIGHSAPTTEVES